MILELVTFQTLPGVSEARFGRAVASVDGFLSERPGFLSRQVLRGEGERDWVDLVWWQDLHSARGAAAAIGADERSAAFLGCLDPDSVTLTHSHLWHTVVAGAAQTGGPPRSRAVVHSDGDGHGDGAGG